jgi:hypothetical protein
MRFVQAHLHHSGCDQWRDRELDAWLRPMNEPACEPAQGRNE